jgi:hypothetical protein
MQFSYVIFSHCHSLFFFVKSVYAVYQYVFICQAGEHYWEVRSMGSLRSLVETRDSRPDLKSVPRMSQPHFIMLWKTMYDLYQAQPEDLETYHSIATIGM